MFAIAFDLTVADTTANHPKSVSQAYPTLAEPWRDSGSNGSREAFA